MLVGLVPPREDKEKMVADFEEAESLVRTYGGEGYAASAQNANRGSRATYIGKGKVEEISETIVRENIDIIVINGQAKPQQIHNLKIYLGKFKPKIVVWDKVELILQIFSKHAATSEAKLQIKIAAMKHMGPRIYGMGFIMSQQGGGIGTKGIGETNTELMRRHWRNEMRQVQNELEKQTDNRERQMENRKKTGFQTVSLIGYTNSGKTTLFNSLTGSHNLVENALFATLDSNVNKLFLKEINKEIYLTDTIGFIQDLPPDLIDAFRSTLMETIHADLLLHVIDITDPRMTDKITVVENILRDLGIDNKNQIYVFNKIDITNGVNQDDLISQFGSFHPEFISAEKGKNLESLLEQIQILLSHPV